MAFDDLGGVSLKAGNQTLRLCITGKDININRMRISSQTSSISIQKISQIQIFPNPISGADFSFRISGLDENEPVNIEIYNLSVQTVHSQKANIDQSGTIDIIFNDKENLNS